MIGHVQPSLLEIPRIVLAYDPARQPDAAGPFECGPFVSTLRDCILPTSGSRAEALALTAFADRLRGVAAERRSTPRLIAIDQVFVAAWLMPFEELVRCLADWAQDAVLHDFVADPPRRG